MLWDAGVPHYSMGSYTSYDEYQICLDLTGRDRQQYAEVTCDLSYNKIGFGPRNDCTGSFAWIRGKVTRFRWGTSDIEAAAFYHLTPPVWAGWSVNRAEELSLSPCRVAQEQIRMLTAWQGKDASLLVTG